MRLSVLLLLLPLSLAVARHAALRMTLSGPRRPAAKLPRAAGGGGGDNGRAPALSSAVEGHAQLVAALRALHFDNSALRRLALDGTHGGGPRQVRGAHLVRVAPTELKSPELVATSQALLLLGLPTHLVEGVAEPHLLPPSVRADLSEYFAGNQLLPGADPWASVYCGHQFGRFAGQLGDGAVISLGEIVVEPEDPRAEDSASRPMGATVVDGGGAGGGSEVRRLSPLQADMLGRWEVQLKGAGATPFSRAADGRKVLRSSIREFLASEAMHALGIPTARAAALVVTDTRVTRDAKGKGQTKEERCAARRTPSATARAL